MSDHTDTLADTEREIADALDSFDEQHAYPVEMDDGLVMECVCGAAPPTHVDGVQVDADVWLWHHWRNERARIVAARVAAARADLLAKIRDIIATPDDEQWWPVQPYTDPANDDEVVEVQVINADRLRALIERADQ